MANGKDLTIVIRAKDVATRVISRVRGVVSRLNRSVIGGLGKLKNAVFSIKTLFAGVLATAAVKTFTSFETGLAKVSTLVDTNVTNMDHLGEAVKRLASETGESFDTLNAGLFDTVSAGVDAADAMGFLEQATKLAIGGGTTTDQAIKGVVSLMNAYGLEAKDAAEISDSLFQAMKGGITTIGLMASNVGKVAPVARQAGLSMDEMNAAVSALTKGGLSTEEAVTALRATLSTLIKPTDEAKAAAAALNIEWDSSALRSKGLVGVLKQLSKDGLKPTVEQQAALAGSSKAFVGVAALAADGAKNFTGILEGMADKSGATDEAFVKMSATLERKLMAAWQSLKVAIVDVLDVFADDIKAAADNFRIWVEENRGNLERLARVFRDWAKLVTAIITGLFSKDGNNAQAAAQFYARTMPAILEAGLKILIEIVALAGKTLGSALVLAMGQEVRKGLNQLTRDLIAFTTPIPGFVLKDLKLFDESDANVAKEAMDDIAEAVQNINKVGKETLDTVLANLQAMKSTASPDVVEKIDNLMASIKAVREEWGTATTKVKAYKRAVEQAAAANANLTPLTGKGGPLEGLSIGPVVGGEGASDPIETLTRDAAAIQEIARLVQLSRLSGVERTKAEITHFYEDELARFQDMLDNKLISEQDFARARTALNAEQAKEIRGLAEAEADQWSQLWDSVKEDIAGVLSNSISTFFNDVVTGTKTVKQAFADMVTSMLSQIGQLLVQAAVARIVLSIFNLTAAANGAVWQGGFTPMANIPKFAKGGVTNGPTLGIVGDNPGGAEAMVPLPDGRNIPVKMEGGGGSANVTLQFNSLDPRTGMEIFRAQKETIKGIVVEALNADPNFVGRMKSRVGSR